MGSSGYLHLIKGLLLVLILCPLYSWGATVGLLVDKKSDQALSFQKHLKKHSPDHNILIVTPEQLSEKVQVDAWFTIGPKVLGRLLGDDTYKQPVLSLFIGVGSSEKLRSLHPQRHFSVLDNTPTLDRQLALIKVLNPHAKQVAVFHSSQGKRQVKGLHKLAQSLNLKLLTSELADPLNWKRDALKTLKDSDLVLAVKDNAIYNATNIRSILMRLYRAGRPLIGPDKGYVRAGAVASTYSGMPETLKICTDLLKDIGKWPEVIHNPYFNVSINAQVARSLNIVVQDSEQVAKAVRELLP